MKTNQELLSSFKQYNKKAREVRAHKLGYPDAAAYMAFLKGEETTVVIKTVTVEAPKKEKKLTADDIPVIHVVDILDASGSMSGGKIAAALTGINSGIKELVLAKVAMYTYTLCYFSDEVVFNHIMINPKLVPTVNIRTISMTALYDAIGQTIDKMKKLVKKNDKVLINIYTDGQENASRGYNKHSVAELIKEFSLKGFTFTFVGTKMDVDFVNHHLNIDLSNSLVYDGTAEGLERGFNETRSARVNYASNVASGQDVSKGFYKNIKK